MPWGSMQSGTSLTSENEVFVSYLREALGKPRHEQVPAQPSLYEGGPAGDSVNEA
jgi:hypothetical protein